jgi:hypothetical protein
VAVVPSTTDEGASVAVRLEEAVRETVPVNPETLLTVIVVVLSELPGARDKLGELAATLKPAGVTVTGTVTL